MRTRGQAARMQKAWRSLNQVRELVHAARVPGHRMLTRRFDARFEPDHPLLVPGPETPANPYPLRKTLGAQGGYAAVTAGWLATFAGIRPDQVRDFQGRGILEYSELIDIGVATIPRRLPDDPAAELLLFDYAHTTVGTGLIAETLHPGNRPHIHKPAQRRLAGELWFGERGYTDYYAQEFDHATGIVPAQRSFHLSTRHDSSGQDSLFTR